MRNSFRQCFDAGETTFAMFTNDRYVHVTRKQPSGNVAKLISFIIMSKELFNVYVQSLLGAVLITNGLRKTLNQPTSTIFIVGLSSTMRQVHIGYIIKGFEFAHPEVI